jgi:hypothetical protein
VVLLLDPYRDFLDQLPPDTLKEEELEVIYTAAVDLGI